MGDGRRWGCTRLVGALIAACSALAPPALAQDKPKAKAAVTAALKKPSCGPVVSAEAGASLQEIAHRCYGSRTYQDWIAAHNHRKSKRLKPGDELKLPTFEVLVRERVAPKWSAEVAAIASGYRHFRKAEPGILAQLKSGKPGVGDYKPTPREKKELEAAARAIKPVAAHLKAGGAKTKKFAQLVETLEHLAKGGSVSTDYGVEGVHQSFSYGVDAIH